MKPYWIKTHRLIKLLFNKYVWDGGSENKAVYLTFDDGPVPEVTEWVLEQLKKHGAKATFFCIGNNIQKNPGIFRKVIAEGHAIGNHTFNHVNGWKLDHERYLENIRECANEMNLHGAETKLFRPPYGRIKREQARKLLSQGYKIVMWDVLSADFDQSITPQQCAQNVIRNVCQGSIIIFHDSFKAYKNLKAALPATLEYLNENGYEFRVLN